MTKVSGRPTCVSVTRTAVFVGIAQTLQTAGVCGEEGGFRCPLCTVLVHILKAVLVTSFSCDIRVFRTVVKWKSMVDRKCQAREMAMIDSQLHRFAINAESKQVVQILNNLYISQRKSHFHFVVCLRHTTDIVEVRKILHEFVCAFAS